MHIREKGVLENSRIYFHTPSNIAKSLFFYMISAGEFYCNENYRVERETFYSYLIMYVKKGNGIVSVDNRTFQAHANDVVMLNCHKPHLYYTDTGWETVWLHFDGSSSKNIFELLYSRFGVVLSMEDSLVVQHCLSMILEGFRHNKPLPEAVVSCHIHRMLTEMFLMSSNSADLPANRINPVLDAITYIHSNFNRKITLEELAANVKVSTFHFSRVFKKETGYSPYEYVIKTRIDQAKVLLKRTGASVKEIAYEVGFNSESNFINTFHASVSLTPNEFRNTPL